MENGKPCDKTVYEKHLPHIRYKSNIKICAKVLIEKR